MTTSLPFDTPDYTSQRNVIGTACKQHAFYLNKILNESEEEIYHNLTTYIKDNIKDFQGRKATILHKNKHGDREIKIVPINKVFSHVRKKNYHFSPSMVAYTNADEEESINSLGTREFISNRNKYKKLRQDAIDVGNNELESKFNKLQNAFKIFNNAQSGAMSSEGTPITNPSGHTTLTSICRCVTSTVNLINEQFIAGNRFYNTPQVTLQSITARILATDLKALHDVIEKYNLYKPQPEDLMAVIRNCTRRYWIVPDMMSVIEEYVQKLTYLELAAVIYTLDLVSLSYHNRKFITQFLDDWTNIDVEHVEPLKIDNGDDHVLCVSKMFGDEVAEDTLAKLNAYHKHVEEKYEDFIKVFFRSTIPPSNLFEVTSSIRDCVLTSDTDSSIYTVDKLRDEYTTDKQKGLRLNGVLTYFIRKISLDQHRQLSINMNIAIKNQRLMEMKNEYFFSGYVTTLMSKHYYALKKMVEGVIMKKPKMEIKGVHLRSVKISQDIRDAANKFMEDVVIALENNKKLDPAVELNKMAELERKVYKELKDGNWRWLSKQGVKAKSRYKLPMSSVYFYHTLWTDVFGDKYGHPEPPPYLGIKVNVDLTTKSKVKKFIDEMEDRELAKRLQKFIEQTGREKFDGFVVPMERLSALNDIPKEIKDVMDFRTIIKQNFKSIYAVLESSGLYFLNDKISRLISDEH